MTALTFDSVTRRFPGVTALDAFTLGVQPGELVTFLGPSGCGKTTALRVAAGFDVPDEGRVLLGERDITQVPAQHRQMGMVFQGYSLFPHLTVADNVAFGLMVRKVSRPSRQARAADMLDLVRISELADRYPHQLSGGQQQRVALARALAFEPAVLLLDEPLSALDAQVRVEVRDEIRHLQRTTGTTTVFVTHDQEEALAISDRVCVMEAGAVHQIGQPAEIYRTPASEFVARFVGVSDEVELGGRRVLVRPEEVAITGEAGTGQFDASVVSTQFGGSQSIVVLESIADGTRLRSASSVDVAAGLVVGTAVGVSVSRVLYPLT